MLLLEYPDPVLSRVAERYDPEKHPPLQTLFDIMTNTMKEHGGRGLAAPQIGFSIRVICIVPEKTDRPVLLANPRITARGAFKQTFNEQCLSVPGVTYPMMRSTMITLRGVTRDGTERSFTWKGIDAACAQHEIDHLEGICLPQNSTNR